MENSLRGLFIPLITPFTADGELAADALERLAHAVLDAGAAGLVALGTTGEPATLSTVERDAVLDICAGVCRDRGAILIAGAGSNDTASTVRALRDLAAWPEVSAALTVVPYYTRPTEDGVIAHFTRLAADSPVPVLVYNIPYRTGMYLSGQALRELVRIPGIAGIKHAVGGIDQDTLTLTVKWKLNSPKPGSFVTQAFTHPGEAVLVEKVEAKVVFDPLAPKTEEKDKR